MFRKKLDVYKNGLGSVQEDKPRWDLLAYCKWEKWIRFKGKKCRLEKYGDGERGLALYVYQRWWVQSTTV
jgi:hypothetical protein